MSRRALSARARSCWSEDLLQISLARSYMRSRELLSVPRTPPWLTGKALVLTVARPFGTGRLWAAQEGERDKAAGPLFDVRDAFRASPFLDILDRHGAAMAGSDAQGYTCASANTVS